MIDLYIYTLYITTADEDEDGVGAEDDESINDSASEVGWNSDDDYAFAHVVGKKRKNVRLFYYYLLHTRNTFRLLLKQSFTSTTFFLI